MRVSSHQNDIFANGANSTLVGAAFSGPDLFELSGAAYGVISSNYSDNGENSYFLEQDNTHASTITGAAGSSYDFYTVVSNSVSGASIGGGQYTITDFSGVAGSWLFLANPADNGPGSATVSSDIVAGGNTIITLSDHTVITLLGVTSLVSSVNGSGQTYFTN